MNDKVTVIIPVYNVVDYLRRCLECVVMQTYHNLEIILVNDGSTDDCPNICEEYAQKDNRIKVIHKENGGLSSARNAGLDNATGNYITFIDSDDIVSFNMIEYLYNTLIDNKADISITTLQKFGVIEPDFSQKNDFDFIVGESKDILIEIIYNRSNWEVCGKLFKNNLFSKKLRFLEGKLYEDLDFTVKILDKSNRVVFTDSRLYGYYQRNNSIMGKSKYNYSEDLIEIIESNISYIEGKHGRCSEVFQKTFYGFIKNANSILERMGIIKFSKQNKQYIKRYKNLISQNVYSIIDNPFISIKYKVGFIISSWSVVLYNIIFKFLRILFELKIINWQR